MTFFESHGDAHQRMSHHDHGDRMTPPVGISFYFCPPNRGAEGTWMDSRGAEMEARGGWQGWRLCMDLTGRAFP